VRRLLLGLALALLAAGCGTQAGPRGASDEPVATDAGSSRIEMAVDGEGAHPMTYVLQGSMDYAHHRGEFSMSGPKADSEPGVRLIFIGRDAYVGMKVLGKMRWQKESNYESTGTDRFLPGPDSASPNRVLALLKKYSSDVEMVGDEDVRGVTTRHYQAHLNTKKLGENELGGPDELVVDAWIDGNGIARRLRIPLGGKDAPVSVIDLFDFGVDVDVQAPPADAIVSEDEFARLAEQECKQEHQEAGESTICRIFTGSLVESGSDSTEISPTETVPTTEGK
jgi:hypothetical protein